MKRKIKLSRPLFDHRENLLIKKVLKNGWVTNGPLTKQFEANTNRLIGCKYSIAVNSCTNGIIAVIKALDLKQGDEILTTPMTFVSVVHALELFKLNIKLIDINLNNFSCNIESIKKNISKKTKCVLITHYGGVPVDTKEIINYCKRKKIFVIEDAATAFGSSYNNQMVGSSNYSISIFSFYANKTITTGEGGIITLKSKILASKIRTIISCGINKDPWKRSFQNKMWFFQVDNFGFKFNFSDIQAALGLAQLEKLRKIIKFRKKIRSRYNYFFKKLEDKKLVFLFKENKKQFFSEYIYTILLNKKKLKISRDQLIEHLKKNNIDTTVHYIPANKHNYYKNKFKKFSLKNSNYVFNNVISLPFHNQLKKKDIEKIGSCTKEFIERNEKK